jgi:hypothetical protein
MWQETQELLQKLEDTDGFASIGQPLPEGLRDSAIVVGSWQKGVACCSSSEWSNFTLEHSNQRTNLLHARAPKRYQQWNDIGGGVSLSERDAPRSRALARGVNGCVPEFGRPKSFQLGRPVAADYCIVRSVGDTIEFAVTMERVASWSRLLAAIASLPHRWDVGSSCAPAR